jgi:thymidylate kinase
MSKVFTKAHAYLASMRGQAVPWRFKFRDMGLLTKWASETLFGRSRRRAFLVVLSGPDGSGKTTLGAGLEKALQSTGERPSRVWIRAGDSALLSPVKELVRRRVHLDAEEAAESGNGGLLRNEKQRVLWCWLATFDLLIRLTLQVRAKLWSGRAVICDRYLADALVDLAYRSSWPVVRGCSLVHLLVRLAPRPDMGYLCDAPLEVRLARRQVSSPGESLQDSEALYEEAEKLVGRLQRLGTTRDEVETMTNVVNEVLPAYYARF